MRVQWLKKCERWQRGVVDIHAREDKDNELPLLER